jgi:hypothetical protein
MWGLAFAAVSAAGQTVLSNADLTAFANAVTAGGAVTLDFDGTITVGNCLSITNSVTLDGSGHAVTISGRNNTEIFAVSSNAALVLQTLTIANGYSSNVSPGAITNGGFLAAYGCVFSNNSSQPTPNANGLIAPGGAIFNAGSMLVSNSSFIQNSAIGAMGNVWGIMPAFGGAIYNAGTAIVTDSTFGNNAAIGGSGVPAFDSENESPSSGAEGQGGAIFNSGAITLSNSTFVQNLSTSGVGGTGMGAGFNSAGPGAQGGGSAGGAIYSAAGSMVIVNSTFLSNSAVGGAGGAGGSAMYAQPGIASLDGGNGGDGVGGAIWLSNGFVSLTNVTFATNTSVGGAGGTGGAPWSVGHNSGTPGTNGLAGAAFGAAAANLGGTFTIKNTLFCAQSNTTNFYGQMTDLGYNLASDYSPSFSAATSRNGVDPKLGTFGYYGGNTQTIPLLLGSPAINGGDPSAFPPVDQRGRHRPSGPPPDIGAFEYTFPTFSNLTVNDSGAQLVLLGEAGDTCVIDVSSNLVDWITLTTNSFGNTNAIEILDTSVSTSGGRYYRANLE